MDFSRLHTYTPPQCLPENTGYTYALSSSYSSSALDFETENKIDPVFDSPRMSRRSLRLAAAGFNKSDDARNDILHDSSYAGNMSFREQASKMVKQRKSMNKQSGSVRHTPRKNLSSSSIFSQSSFNSHASDTSMVSTVLDESLIREQTEVDHFWGLDDEGDPKGSDATLMQGNGDIAAETQTTMINGYTCSDCSMLSERKEVLTAYSASHVPSSRIYSRDRSQKHASRGTYFYMSKILRLVRHAAASFASLLVQLFQMVLLKLGYEFKAHSDYCGSMNVKEFYREDSCLGVNEESICDDCKGKKHLEIYTTDHMQSSWAKRVARTIWHTFSYAGYFMLHLLRTVGATGWLVSQKVVSLLWLAILSPGRAASGMFRLLRTGWYQLVTLMSFLKVFLLRRCLPKIYKLLLFLIPLLFLLGIWFWGFDGFISLLPSLNWTRIDRIQRIDDSINVPEPQADSFHSVQPPKDTVNIFDSGRISELEKQMAFVSDRCHHHDEEYSKVMLLLHNLQDQVAQMSDKSETLKLIKNVMGQHLKDMKLEEKTDFLALHEEHELRIRMLEDLLGKLSAESKDIQKELDIAKAKTVRDDGEHSQLLSKVKKLELELSQMKSELLTGESVKTSCEKIDVIHEKVDAQVKESVKLMLFGDQQEDFPESLLQWLTSNFVSKSDLQTLLRDLELQILKNITLHMSVTNQKLTSEVVTNAVTNAGISGITEAQAQIIVNNALKLYSQDKTGMVDFALESGGGSILSTRCSETYETKTALISLFGIPLWYFSQSPRVVIQPDMYPGNCWAFKGSQGYLVVRLSMKIYPTAFTVEHIPKTLSPTGNITSAPRNFSVYGLDDEYQEEGKLLGQYVYDQGGEPLQMFPVMEKSENAFQIVELRIFSNWGHAEYTCLYRFRVHGKPAE
ncbi:PREDICTED: SUN domain-containing protein 1 isoform X1 [Pygoscelis adeliae]|uniref:SUN domain-containing protein 1 isoform X1 n=1 Tax=Pygoscelis adeliae TaxID=9238 RepID=UPI0004F4F9A1|nr:PREDICTED: SUN domain-containing protein 1 isoform X1 [Pygoscelis adeliae]XP_009318281.1 PREDICTED: SUN domain-containing protein 1 isoform X1 [Pygoscelis adeliae]XP_009318282.1 PREDICTED: SUN domain-containing protein 1 isoform X1 [Pygoscelis adeliae]